jgi:hypothetical protein
MKEKKRWKIHFEPKEDITAYELALIVNYSLLSPSLNKFRQDWKNGTLSESLKRHVRIEEVE